MQRTIEEEQQEFAERSSNHAGDAIWNLLSVNEQTILKDNLKELVPDQEKCQPDILELRSTLNESIWSERLATNHHKSLIIIQVLVTQETDFNSALKSVEFSTHPVYISRSADDENGLVFKNNTSIFIDEEGRVYEDWHSYVKHNTLQNGTMVAPYGGSYSFDEDGMVKLEVCATPTSKVVRSHQNQKARTVKDIQQDFANSSGYRKEVIWDLLSEEQGGILKKKIRELIPGQGKDEHAIIELRETLFSKMDHPLSAIIYAVHRLKQLATAETKGQKALEDVREILYKSVWAQRKYTNRNSLTAIIYVLVTKETDFNRAPESGEFSCHPVFRARKCVAEKDSSKCCMVFVDEVGRVYQNWKSYVSDNELPMGTMLAPKNGIYTFDDRNVVQLDVYATPASGMMRRLMSVADTTSAVAGFASACVPIAALLTLPVTAPAMAVATGVGLTVAGYSTIRSGSNLVERSQHEQSIGLRDRQARNSWLGVAAGMIGLGASGATRAMTTAAAAGREISVVTELVVNGMNISSVVLSGTGVANGVLDMVLKYNDDEDISALDILQLSASLVLFTHSVSNFRLASNIVNETRNGSIKAYRDGLSNRQRRMFNKMSKETIRMQGEARGKMDIIRTVNDIPSKQYLNDLYKINRQLNEQKVRPAFGGADRGIVLNNELSVDTKVLRNNVQHKIGPDVLGQVNKPIPQAHQDASIRGYGSGQVLFANYNTNTDVSSATNQQPNLSPRVRALSFSCILLGSGVKVALSDFGTLFFEHIVNAESFENVITSMRNLDEDVFRLLMNLTQLFIDEMLDKVETVLKMFISSESVLYRILLFCLQHYANRSYEYLEKQTLVILEAVKDYFLSLNPDSFPDLLKRCQHCLGYFAMCEL